MKKMNNKRGFTLAELLIVVAIIAVLVAISIPIFTNQLERSRDAVTVSNIRAAYAMAQTAYLTQEGDSENGVTYNAASGSTPTTVVVTNIVAKGEKDTLGTTATELPFTLTGEDMGNKSNGTSGKFKITFTYDANGKITSAVAAAA